MKDKLIYYKQKYPVNSKMKHKKCNLKIQILGYKEDLFGTYVKTKVIDHIFNNKYHYYGMITSYDIDILKEYEIIK